MSQYPERVDTTGEEERWRDLSRRATSGPSVGLVLAGLVVLGVGALAWQYFAPDVRRYLKIRNM
jgi:hypothetical protein